MSRAPSNQTAKLDGPHYGAMTWRNTAADSRLMKAAFPVEQPDPTAPTPSPAAAVLGQCVHSSDLATMKSRKARTRAVLFNSAG